MQAVRMAEEGAGVGAGIKSAPIRLQHLSHAAQGKEKPERAPNRRIAVDRDEKTGEEPAA
jgi:hypothetical protein